MQAPPVSCPRDRADVTIRVVGGKARRLWPVAAIVVVIAVAGALVWVVWRSPHQAGLSTFGAFAVAVVVPAASLVVYLKTSSETESQKEKLRRRFKLPTGAKSGSPATPEVVA